MTAKPRPYDRLMAKLRELSNTEPDRRNPKLNGQCVFHHPQSGQCCIVGEALRQLDLATPEELEKLDTIVRDRGTFPSFWFKRRLQASESEVLGIRWLQRTVDAYGNTWDSAVGVLDAIDAVVKGPMPPVRLFR